MEVYRSKTVYIAVVSDTIILFYEFASGQLYMSKETEMLVISENIAKNYLHVTTFQYRGDDIHQNLPSSYLLHALRVIFSYFFSSKVFS